jgi:hypothetical protein
MHYALDPPVPGARRRRSARARCLLKDGAWYEDKHAPAPDERDVRWPVIAIGTMPPTRYMFVAVDGRHPERSIGMTRPEFGDPVARLRDDRCDGARLGRVGDARSRAPGNSAITVRNVPSDFERRTLRLRRALRL